MRDARLLRETPKFLGMRPERGPSRCDWRRIIGASGAIADCRVVRRSGLDRARVAAGNGCRCRPGSGRCCSCNNGRLRPLRDATSVGGESPGVRPGVSENAAFYPEKPWRARPSQSRAECSSESLPCVADARAEFATILQKGVAMQLTGAEIVIRCLQEEGVEYVFGYPGGAVLNIYDEFFKQDKVKHVLVRHEQGAVHAADGYSRSSTKVGVALVTSGPGVTNAVTGIATAYMDSIPMVVLTGQVPTHAIGQDAFQECDTVGITRPCVKHNFLVKDVKDLAVTIKKAFYLAATGRPGPVLVDIPKDVTQATTEFALSEDGLAALVQSGDQGPRGPDQEGGAAAARGQAADGLRRRRRDPEQRGAAADAARAPAGLPVHQHADGPGRLPRHRPAVHRHARHARHVRVEHGDAALRRADRDRRALRRSRDRQSGALLPRRPQDHPHRHRSVVDLQAGEGRRADRRLRRRRAGRDAEADRDVAAAARSGRAQGMVGRDQGMAAQGLPAATTRRATSSSRSS